MSFLSILAFTAVNVPHRSRAKTYAEQHAATFRRADAHFEQIKVVVASKDALLARKALLSCPYTAIIRCVPRHEDDRVELDIRFPAGHGDSVIDQIMACLPHGEIGGIVACATPHPKARASQASMGQLYGF